MLAARRLYPGAVVCLAGSLNRNVREFYRLHADELDFVVDASRLELDAVRRLIVVETVHAAGRRARAPRPRSGGRQGRVRHHGEEELPGWAPAENVVISEDGALTTTLVGVLASARCRSALSRRRSSRSGSTRTRARSRTRRRRSAMPSARLVPAPRRGAGGALAASCTPRWGDERELFSTLLDSVEPHEVAGIEVLVAAATAPEYVEGISNLAHKLIDVTDSAGLACSSRWTTGSSR